MQWLFETNKVSSFGSIGHGGTSAFLENALTHPMSNTTSRCWVQNGFQKCKSKMEIKNGNQNGILYLNYIFEVHLMEQKPRT